MDVITVVGALLEVVLKLVDRETAKKTLDQLDVRLANLAADEAEKAKFGPFVAPGS